MRGFFPSSSRVALLLILSVSFLPNTPATSWAPRPDIGVAAVDGRTGKVLWEAWRADEIPAGTSNVVRAGAKKVLDPKWSEESAAWAAEYQKSERNELTVKSKYENEKQHLILYRGQYDRGGIEVARYSTDDIKSGWGHRVCGEFVYVHRGRAIDVFALKEANDAFNRTWRPIWTYEPPPENIGTGKLDATFVPTHVRFDAEGIWILRGTQLDRFSPRGRNLESFTVDSKWHTAGREPWAYISAGKATVYIRSGTGVVVIDRKAGHETWRLPTTRYPYPSEILEADNGVVLVRIGSNNTRTLHAVLGGDRDYSLPKLGPLTARQLATAATLLHAYGDGYLRTRLRTLADGLRPLADADARAAVTTVDKLLATWPAKRENRRLPDACVSLLIRSQDVAPATDRVLSWCQLQELIYGQVPDAYDRPGTNYAYHEWKELELELSDDARAKLRELCRQTVANGPEAERPFAASALVASAVGWESLSNAERKALVLSPQSSVWRWAAMAMLKNGHRQQLLEWADARPTEDQSHLVCLLCTDVPAKRPELEIDYFLRALRRDPGEVALVIQLFNVEPIPAAAREPLRAFLKLEIAEPKYFDDSSRDSRNCFAALGLLDRLKNPDDDALIAKYLAHPYVHYSSLGGGKSTKHFQMRRYAADLLAKRGVKPPGGTLFEETVPDPKK